MMMPILLRNNPIIATIPAIAARMKRFWSNSAYDSVVAMIFSIGVFSGFFLENPNCSLIFSTNGEMTKSGVETSMSVILSSSFLRSS
ncbi:MAG: hypothetical protein A4E42_02479 [Methanoregulaceae archaeon PtaU1.Bin222]|nr:MAG: hypothetical protein A4E42_02479 [Methanoregulaceae archaeon PtaU1.Bin222]